MAQWRVIADRLYASLKSMPCRCQYERNSAGVPLWTGVPIERRLVHHCSKCKAMDMYEAAIEVEGVCP